MANSFSAGVGAWGAKSMARITAIRRRSVELLAEEMTKTNKQGGLVPFQTGNLSRSLLASTSGMPMTSEAESTGSNIGAVTAVLGVDQPVWLGYQAVYAKRQNYGFVGTDSLGRTYNQAGAHFVENAVANWSQIVETAANELQTQVESRNK